MEGDLTYKHHSYHSSWNTQNNQANHVKSLRDSKNFQWKRFNYLKLNRNLLCLTEKPEENYLLTPVSRGWHTMSVTNRVLYFKRQFPEFISKHPFVCLIASAITSRTSSNACGFMAELPVIRRSRQSSVFKYAQNYSIQVYVSKTWCLYHSSM
jgi:hypothetical protein